MKFTAFASQFVVLLDQKLNPFSARFASPMGRAILLAFCFLATTQVITLGQNVQHTKGAADHSLRSDFKVSPTNFGLNISIPLQAYSGRAGLNIPITLSYSSKVWRVRYAGYAQMASNNFEAAANFTLTRAVYGEDSAAGWTSSLSLPKIVYEDDFQRRNEYDREGRPCSDGVMGTGFKASDPCHPSFRKTVYRIRLRLPDGSTHELRKSASIFSATLNDGSDQGLYEAVDDSRLRYDTRSGTTYLPDGSRYEGNSYIDRNGNKLTLKDDGTWQDTLGRSISIPQFNEDNSTRAAGDVEYKLPGLGGELRYVFRWRKLTDVRTNGDSTVYQAGDRLCGGSFRQALTPSLFESKDEDLVCGYDFNPVVLWEIELPNRQVYRFTYNKYGEIDKVVYPTGGYEVYEHQPMPGLSSSNPPYAQSSRGVSDRWVSTTANGPVQEPHWRYSAIGALTETLPDGTYTKRFIHGGKAPDDVRFGFDDVRSGMISEEQVFSPSGEMLRRKLTKWEYIQDLATVLPDGTHVFAQRHPRVSRTVDILLDTENADPLAKTTKYHYGQSNEPLNVTAVTEYDFVRVPRATAKGSAIDSIPFGTALRSTQTVYKNDESYRSRNLVTLPENVTVLAGEPEGSASPGTIVSRTKTYYDELSYAGTSMPLLSCAPTTGREATTPQERGNVTTVSRWLNTSGTVDNDNAYIDGRMQFDQCGNVRKSYEAVGRGIVSDRVTETEYSSRFQFAYPTRSISPLPDPSGQHGSATPLVTSIDYDFTTGLVLKTRDESNFTSTNVTDTIYSYHDPDTGAVDPLNRLRLVTSPDGGKTRYNYGDTIGQLFVRTRIALDSSRMTDSYQYFDGIGRQTRSYVHDGTSPLAWVASEKQYDPMGRVTLSSNPARVSNQGDAMPPGTEWTTTDYDDLGRVEHVTTPDNAMTSTSYGGNIVTMVDQANKKRRSETDALGRLVKVTEAPEVTGYGYETTYGYDTLGNLRTVTQDGQTRTFVYDSLKRQTSARIPEGCQQQGGGCAPIPVSYEYNPNGSLKQKTDSRGIQTKFDYDGLGRLKFRSYITPAGMEITPDVTYRYDGAGASSPVANSKGRLTLVTSSISSFSYDAYDVMGRVKAASQTTDFKSYATSYEYDLAGNLQAETYPTGRKITTSFDIAGRVESVTGYASEFRYAPHGALASVKLGNGLWEHTNYNSRLQPVEIGLGTTRNEPSTNSSVLRLVYNYESFDQTGKSLRDNNGNVHSQKISMPGLELTQSYDYDPLNRLKIAQELKGGAEQWKQNYVYDRFGNRRLDAGTTFPNLSQNLDDVRMNPKIDPSTNRLFENQDGNASTKEYSYDVAGNLILDADGRTFIYDAENKQTSFNGGLNFPNVSATYFYDGDGRRVKRETAEGKTVFVYDAMGKLVAEYTNEERRPDEGGTKYLTEDNLGSPRVITDQNKTVVSRHDYAPFGEELTMARTEQYKPDSIRQQFTGQERDKESGLDYFDARYYSSIQGRFTSIDPLAASGNIANPQTWNRYTYVLNNPLRLIDPTGMSPVDQETQQAQSVTQTPPPGEIPRDIPPPVSTVWQVQLVAITQPDVTQAYPPMTNGEGLLRSALGIPNTVTLPGGDVIEDVEVGVGLQQIADEIMLADWQPALAEAKRDYSSRNATGFDEFTQREDQSQSKEFGADIPGGPNAKNSSTFGQGTETKIFGDRAAQKQSIFENRTNAGYHAWRLTQAPISNPSSSLNGQTLSIKEARNFRDRIYQRNRDIAKSYH